MATNGFGICIPPILISYLNMMFFIISHSQKLVKTYLLFFHTGRGPAGAGKGPDPGGAHRRTAGRDFAGASGSQWGLC